MKREEVGGRPRRSWGRGDEYNQNTVYEILKELNYIKNAILSQLWKR